MIDARHLNLIGRVWPDDGQWCSIRFWLAAWKGKHGR